VTLPQLRPALAGGGLLVALYALSDFGAVSLLRFDTFSRAIYVQYRGSFDRHLAAVLALVLILATVVVLLVEARSRGRAAYHRGSGLRRPAPVLRLGRWRWPGLAFCATVVGLAVVLPLGVIGTWLVHGLAQGETVGFLWRPTLNSLAAAGLAALVTPLAALPIALLSVRYPSRWTSFVEHASYAGFALPPIATALALVFFTARFLPWLYQTLALLVLAYALRFLPQAVAPVRAALLQVGPQLEEAGRGLGRSPLQVLRAVTLPLVRPGVLAGAALVGLTAMKELPATLLLSPAGFSTLATQTWSAASDAYFARAAASSLLLVLFSALSLAVVLAGERSGWRA
jgi:iron(III) transport system permease protein